MATPEKIVFQDKRIAEILGAGRGNDAHDLFEYYRISASQNRDVFVAALIGRLCVLEAQKRLDRETA